MGGSLFRESFFFLTHISKAFEYCDLCGFDAGRGSAIVFFCEHARNGTFDHQAILRKHIGTLCISEITKHISSVLVAFRNIIASERCS